MTQDLLKRIQALEAREAIRTLKHRYLACCDNKDTAGFRACFVDGTVDIDYGAIGTFDSADDLVAIFKQVGCHPHMLEWHHASNDQIELISDTQATGRWSLHYQLVNSEEGNLTQIGGEYEDEYRLTEQGWQICKTHFKPRTCVVLKLDEAGVKTVFAGAPQNMPG